MRYFLIMTLVIAHLSFFVYFAFGTAKDPESDRKLTLEYLSAIHSNPQPHDWNFELTFMTSYEKLNLLLRYQQRKSQDLKLKSYAGEYTSLVERNWLADILREKKGDLIRQGLPLDRIPSDSELKKEILQETPSEVLNQKISIPTLWQIDQNNREQEMNRLKKMLVDNSKTSTAYQEAQSKMHYLQEKQKWLKDQSEQLKYEVWPLIRTYHWEDDAGGDQSLNQYIPWWELTRTNRKDLVAALIFGIRISLVVGITAVAISLMIGIPVGAVAGFYGGTIDIIICRLLEIWEAMPTFFMLLLVVAITQSKSIFLVITVIGIFGWTGFSRYIRGEFFKQRNLAYIESCRAQGFSHSYIMFSHILPNAIPPLLTLLPFAVMGAITSEAGLSFLGLGEENSCSWGVLMDEGRTAFPSEAYLLWPPAILLTILLIAIALIGDALRDALDPKMHKRDVNQAVIK